MALIPVLRRQNQVDFYEFKAGLVYRVSLVQVPKTERNPVSKN